MKRMPGMLVAFLTISILSSGCRTNSDNHVSSNEGNPAPQVETFTVVMEEADTKGRPLEKAIQDYQKKHPQIHINVETLLNSSPPANTTEEEATQLSEQRSAQVSRLRAEVMSGKGPDLFLLRTSYIWADNLFADVSKAIYAGTFCDLAPYLVADSNFRTEDFYAPLLEAGNVNGKQYVMPLSFTMPMFLTTSKNLVSIGFDQVAAEKNMTAFLGEAEKCLPAEQWNAMTLINYAEYLDQPLLDYRNSSVQLDTEAVRMAMTYAKKFKYPDWQPDPYKEYNPTLSLSPDYTGDLDRTQKLISGQLKLFGCPLFLGGSIPAHAQIMQKLGGQPLFLNLPNEKGGVTATMDSYAAIRANSSHAKTAYGFISYLLSRKCQEQKAYPGVYLPVRKDSLQNNLELGRTEYWTENRNALNQSQAMSNKMFQDFSDTVNRMTTAHLQRLFSSGSVDYGDHLSGLLMDLEQDYYNGGISLDDFIDQSTKQLQLYLEE